MNFRNYIKYGVRFIILQFILTSFSIFYFDKFLINEYVDGYLIIINNLLEDRDRFYPFIQNDFIKIDIYIAFFVFVFLVILYSTKFYTYVNELSFSLDKKFFDEYLNIYLLWTSSLMTFLFFFRFSVVSRFYLFIFTIIVPIILELFRNTEVLSSILGRSVTNEKYITINLSKDSIFRNLRIMTFRKNLENLEINLENDTSLIQAIDIINKSNEINLLVLDLKESTKISERLENYLLNLNKKILLITNSQITFNSFFISKTVSLSGSNLIYFNNDIQYGSKYIIKRAIDIFITVIILTLSLPVLLIISFFIVSKDGFPFVIKQKRVGLHGKIFDMYKFRTMYSDSHKKRESMNDLNKNDKVIFKIENDPRIFNGGEKLRKYSLDELPQLINVLKGEMSLVGPRPLFEEDTQHFNENYMRRLNVMPGLTGLLQINERNTSEFEVWYKYDMEYINNWSLSLDLSILFKTPISILKNNSKGL